MAETIRVTHLADDAQLLKSLDMIVDKLQKVEKQAKKTADISGKGADATAGSFNALEYELKQNEAALKKMVIGSADFTAQKAKVDALRKSYDAAKQGVVGHNQQASRLQTLAGGATAKLAGLAAGMLSVHGAVQAISEELNKIERNRLAAAGTERTFEQALADIGQNIGGENIGAARTLIREQAPQLGVTQEGLANLLGTAISAGANDLKEAMSVTTTALKATVGDADKANALIGGALDIASLAQSKNYEGALGQLLQVQSQVRSTTLSEFAANIGPAVAAATAQGQNVEGLSTERALEISAVVSQILKDQTGSNTATTVRQFVTRMDSFMPELEKVLEDGGKATLTQEQITAFAGERSFDARVQMMREVPALALQFLETQREGVGKTAVREIVQGTERTLLFEAKAVASIDSLDKAAAKFDTLIDNVNQATPVLRAERRAQANVEAFRTGGTEPLEGQAQKIFADTVAEVDLPGLDLLQTKVGQMEIKLRTAAGESTADVAIDILQRLRDDDAFGKRQLSAEEKAFFNTQIELLREMRDANRQPPPPQPVVVQAPQVRPKEAPVPMKTVP